MTPSLDVNFVRSQFPAFNSSGLKDQAFFESAGGSFVCRQVLEYLQKYYVETKVQPYGFYPASQQAGMEMDLSYARLAQYLNVDKDEVHIGPSTSQNTYVLAQAFSKVLLPGDEIIVTNQDHEANTGVWRRLENLGFIIKEWQVDPKTGELNQDDLDLLFSKKTKLLVFPHCSNIVAHINPVRDICAKAKAANVWTVVDGVSYAGHGLPDVSDLGADIYLFSLYKTFGPHQGLMVIRQNMANKLGNEGHYFNAHSTHKRFVPAGPDHAQVAASRGVSDYFDLLHAHHFPPANTDQERAHDIRTLLRSAELQLLPDLLNFLKADSRVVVLGPQEESNRAAMISVIPKNLTPREAVTALSTKGLMCGAGNFYSVRLLNAMNVNPEKGVLRISFVHYTSPIEVSKLINALDEVL